jgi:hypothetical protein
MTTTTNAHGYSPETQAWIDEMNRKQPALQAAFSRVQNPQDWKAEINWVGTLTTADAVLTIEAIEHFTATKASIRYLSDPTGAEGRALVQITADGYRRGPAN